MYRGAGQPEHVRRKKVGGRGGRGDRGAGARENREGGLRGREAGAEIKKAIVCCLLLGII